MPGSHVLADFWMYEYMTPWDIYAHGVTAVMAYRRTAFQDMHIVETGRYGKALVLDGKWQSCTGDEFLYHEPLVHPAMLQYGDPRRVLILGGGEGATAREVLRWKSVEKCVMVDIDGEVVEACKEHLPEMHQGVFDNPKLEVVIDDALVYLDRAGSNWDVVISDLSDPIEEGPSFKLFTKEYYQQVKQVLSPKGIFVLQAGPVSPSELYQHARLVRTMETCFDHVASVVTSTVTYGSPWSFILGADRPLDTNALPQKTDAQIAERTTGGLKMLDGISLVGMYHTPKHLRDAIRKETQIYTQAAPPKFFGVGAVQKAGAPV